MSEAVRPGPPETIAEDADPDSPAAARISSSLIDRPSGPPSLRLGPAIPDSSAPSAGGVAWSPSTRPPGLVVVVVGAAGVVVVVTVRGRVVVVVTGAAAAVGTPAHTGI